MCATRRASFLKHSVKGQNTNVSYSRSYGGVERDDLGVNMWDGFEGDDFVLDMRGRFVVGASLGALVAGRFPSSLGFSTSAGSSSGCFLLSAAALCCFSQ